MQRTLISIIFTAMVFGIAAHGATVWTCTASSEIGTAKVAFEIQYRWVAGSPSVHLVFESALTSEGVFDYEVIYQGIGAEDFNSKPQGLMVAVSRNQREMVTILWEKGSGFGWSGFANGSMKAGNRLLPGAFMGIYSAYSVSCQEKN